MCALGPGPAEQRRRIDVAWLTNGYERASGQKAVTTDMSDDLVR
jgi:hypothetical protein